MQLEMVGICIENLLVLSYVAFEDKKTHKQPGILLNSVFVFLQSLICNSFVKQMWPNNYVNNYTIAQKEVLRFS